jgi:hypothetical protein
MIRCKGKLNFETSQLSAFQNNLAMDSDWSSRWILCLASLGDVHGKMDVPVERSF